MRKRQYGNEMKLDYILAAPTARGRHRRVFWLAGGCAAVTIAVLAHESIANRTPVSVLAASSDPVVAAAFSSLATPTNEESLQLILADSLPLPPASNWVKVKVQKGESLSQIFERENLAFSDAIAIINAGKHGKALQSLRAGDTLQLLISPEHMLEELRYDIDETHSLQVRRSDDGFHADLLTVDLERREASASVVIENSLFFDGNRAGLSDRLLLNLAEAFGSEIDFALDLRRGDRFAVIYEELYKDGKRLRDGDIVAVEFINNGRVLRALRHVDTDGQSAYYTPKGLSLRKSFIRTPVDFARISSPFNPKRRHPILNTIRAHKGVDYAAAAGTPIKATGDGKVEFIGVKNGYGRTVILKHGTQYTTLYAHMSAYRKGLRVGAAVRQGQVIGYVGMSGLATAPHLHYEFRINGVHKNPVTVALPRANSLPRSKLAEWKMQTASLLAKLDQISTPQTAGLTPSH